MSAAKHTPGPWAIETVPTCIGTCHKIGPFPSLGSRTETHACVYADNVREHDYGHSKVGDELLANARLIAAAPELVAVAEMVMAWWEEHQYDTKGEYGDFNVYDSEPDFVTAARAAIAKATGEAP